MELSPARLFDGFPEAVLLTAEGVVRYCNPAAVRMFPELAAGAPAPEAVAALLEGARPPAVLSGVLAGAPCTVTVQDAGDEVLVILRAEARPAAGPDLERLALRLRQETAGMAAALQHLDPTEGEPSEEKARRYLAAANQGLYRLMRLCDHLEFAERSGEAVYHPAPLDLAGFCRELADQIEGVCRLAGYRFSYETELSGLLTTGDERLLRRLVLSLISNALKAAGEGGSLGLKLLRRGNAAVVQVWDGGQGVESGGLARLFGGTAGQPPTLDPGEGLGLGLDAVRRIAELHGGTVLMEANPGRGLRCAVSLPVRRPGGKTVLRSPRADYSGGFSPLLVELSDVLPVELFLPEYLA